MKLKTLKDLEIWDCEACGGEIMHRPDIKQEAIKWVKKLNGFRYRGDEGFIDDETGEFYEFPGWIEHFFNITEEDLK